MLAKYTYDYAYRQAVYVKQSYRSIPSEFREAAFAAIAIGLAYTFFKGTGISLRDQKLIKLLNEKPGLKRKILKFIMDWINDNPAKE